MNSRLSDSDSLIGTVDFRGFLETLRLRWWLLPAVVALSVGFIQAQTSDLSTEPATFFISRSYEMPPPAAVLAATGVPLASLQEIPDADSQFLVLGSNEVKNEIEKALGREIEVSLPKSYETPIAFTCNTEQKSTCEDAITAYTEKLIEIRREALSKGLMRLKSILEVLDERIPDPTIDIQLATVDALLANLEVSLVLLDSAENSIGPTVIDINRQTYLLGIGSGIVIALLIILQLTFVDSRVRSVRQLIRLVGSEHYLGTASKKASSVGDRRVAIALSHGVAGAATLLRYIPLRFSPSDTNSLSRVAELAGVRSTVASPFVDLSVQELTKRDVDEVDVIVVQRNRDRRRDLVEVIAALQRSSRRLVGVLLVD